MRNSFFKNVRVYLKKPDLILHKEVFVIILCLPILYIVGIAFFVKSQTSAIRMVEKEVVFIENLTKKALSSVNSTCPNKVDPDYVSNILGNMTFLSSDRKELAILCAEVSDGELYSRIKERLSFLQSGENDLQFRSTEGKDEIVWDIANRIEMNGKDLKKLISHVEGTPIAPFFPNPNRPNLFFSKISLKRDHTTHSDLFSVNLQIYQKRT